MFYVLVGIGLSVPCDLQLEPHLCLLPVVLVFILFDIVWFACQFIAIAFSLQMSLRSACAIKMGVTAIQLYKRVMVLVPFCNQSGRVRDVYNCHQWYWAVDCCFCWCACLVSVHRLAPVLLVESEQHHTDRRLSSSFATVGNQFIASPQA